MSVLEVISDVVGWAYFVSWSISFYPQVYQNWKRKSVVGFSFDYTVYNLFGYLCYSTYQCALYFSPHIQDEYKHEHDTDDIGVKLNDVVFALHGVALVLIEIVQIFMYERGDQRVSWVCMGITALLLSSIGVVGILVLIFLKIIWWLEMLGYIKALITVIKYTPQVYINWKSKSTEGWSIWGVIFDISGGVLSFSQMALLSIDKKNLSEFSDLPKLALAVISLLYDAIFMFQHYVLYRNNHPQPLLQDDNLIYTKVQQQEEEEEDDHQRPQHSKRNTYSLHDPINV